MSFCRFTAKRIMRSLRRRCDRCHLSWWKEKVNYPTEDILQQRKQVNLKTIVFILNFQIKTSCSISIENATED